MAKSGRAKRSLLAAQILKQMKNNTEYTAKELAKSVGTTRLKIMGAMRHLQSYGAITHATMLKNRTYSWKRTNLTPPHLKKII